jgi:hypothetical protein
MPYNWDDRENRYRVTYDDIDPICDGTTITDLKVALKPPKVE